MRADIICALAGAIPKPWPENPAAINTPCAPCASPRKGSPSGVISIKPPQKASIGTVSSSGQTSRLAFSTRCTSSMEVSAVGRPATSIRPRAFGRTPLASRYRPSLSCRRVTPPSATPITGLRAGSADRVCTTVTRAVRMGRLIPSGLTRSVMPTPQARRHFSE